MGILCLRLNTVFSISACILHHQIVFTYPTAVSSTFISTSKLMIRADFYLLWFLSDFIETKVFQTFISVSLYWFISLFGVWKLVNEREKKWIVCLENEFKAADSEGDKVKKGLKLNSNRKIKRKKERIWKKKSRQDGTARHGTAQTNIKEPNETNPNFSVLVCI